MAILLIGALGLAQPGIPGAVEILVTEKRLLPRSGNIVSPGLRRAYILRPDDSEPRLATRQKRPGPIGVEFLLEAQRDIQVGVHGSEDLGWKVPPVAKNGIFRSAPIVGAGEGRLEQDSLALA